MSALRRRRSSIPATIGLALAASGEQSRHHDEDERGKRCDKEKQLPPLLTIIRRVARHEIAEDVIAEDVAVVHGCVKAASIATMRRVLRLATHSR